MSAQEKPETNLENSKLSETRELRLLYGTYADILFVLLPFTIVGNN
jgi:hypothetical protein